MKIEVSVFTWILVILAFFSGWLVPLGHVFLIMTLHELGHALWAWIFNYPIRRLTILPFGLAMTLEEFGCRDAGKEIVILIGGLSVHLLIPVLYSLAVGWGWVSAPMAQWVLLINRSALLFNSLPLYPLDGGRIGLSLLHYVLPFTQAEKAGSVLSLVLLPVIFIAVMKASPATLLVFGFLGLMNVMHLRQLQWQRRQFYLLRLHHAPLRPVKIHAHSDLYRQRLNVVLVQGVPLLEEDWIHWYFRGRLPQRESAAQDLMI